MNTNLNWVKGLSSDQQTARLTSMTAQTAYKNNDFSFSILMQDKAAAEYEACRSMYRHLFQQSIEINHD